MFNVGIDLGTTNTVMATCKASKRLFFRPHISKIYQYLHTKQMGYSDILPSVLFFNNDGKCIVGEYAKDKKEDGAYSRILYNTKLDMGRKIVYNHNFTPVKSAAEILRVCYESLKAEITPNLPFPDVTITVPASFSQNQIADTIEAAKLSGFEADKVKILEEPIAALLYYVNLQLMSAEEDAIDFSSKKRVLVYDIGGGTCDVCVVDIQIDDNNSYDIKFIATNRYTEFGGNDFDEIVTIKLLNKLFEQYNISDRIANNYEIKNELVSKILPFCEQYKIWYAQQLKFKNENNIENASYAYLDEFFDTKNVELALSYQEYKDYTQVFFEDNYTHPSRNLTNKLLNKNIIKPVYQILNYLRINYPDYPKIDCIFLTGGMSEYLPIEQALKNYCQVPIIKTDDPMYAVALGASIYNYIKTNKSEISSEANLQNSANFEIDYNRPKLAESIFIDIENSLPLKIIDAETTIPQQGVVPHKFKVSSGGVCFNLFAGLSEFDPEMRILYNYYINFDFIVQPNTIATIRYEINENRLLRLFLDLEDSYMQSYELTVDIG